VNIHQREDKIAELIFSLTQRDRDSVAACCRLAGAIAIVGKGMNTTNRMHCAEMLRSVGDDVEAHSQPAFERV